MDYMKSNYIPMSSPDISELEQEYVNKVMQTNYLSMGPYILAFEKEFQKFTGAKNAIAVSSGTAGLHLCVRAADWADGDYVITTPFSFVSSTNVLLYERITPIFVDAEPSSGNINAEQAVEAIKDLISSETKARRWLPPKGFQAGNSLKGVLSVDVFGQPADYDMINQAAKENGLQVIEDSCEALGARYKDRPAGCLADFGVFAFYPNKQITTGEGGLVVTNNEHHAEIIRALRNQGRAPGDTWLDHSLLGYNYRLNELNAALGLAQMQRIDQLIADRNQVAAWYREELQGIEAIECPNRMETTTFESWFVFVIRLKKGINRMDASEKLTRMGIPTRPYFSPIHLQPYMREKFGYREGMYPITEDLGNRGLAIPFSGKMTREQVKSVGAALRQVLE